MTEDNRPAGASRHRLLTGAGVAGAGLAAAPAFLDCPAYLRGDGTVRCGLPAEVEERYRTSSTGGPLDSVRIRCPRGHWFNGHIESLTMPGQPAAAGVSAC